MRPTIAAAALAGLIALVAAGLTGCSSTLGYAAVVNGTVIGESSLNADLAAIAKNTQYVKNVIDASGGSGPFYGSSGPGSYSKAFVASLLQSLVQREIIHQVLAANRSLPTAAQVRTAQGELAQVQYFNNFSAGYKALVIDNQADTDAFIRLESARTPHEAVASYYHANKSNYLTEACVRYILVANTTNGKLDLASSRTTAAQVSSMLAAGGDFATLAKKYSQDPATASKGGTIPGSAADGCLSNNDLVQISNSIPAFAKAVVTQTPNQVSQPIESSIGYLIIQVTSEVIQPLDASVTSDIQQRLAGQALNGIMQKANVKVNPEFGSFDPKVGPTGLVTGVVPPPTPTFGTTTTTLPVAAGS